MEEQQPKPEEPKQEVTVTKEIEGKIRWFGNPRNPVPSVLANIGKAVRYGCTGLITAVNSAPKNVISVDHASAYSWWLSVFIILSGAFELLVGVEPAKKNIPILIFVFVSLCLLLK